MSWRKNSSSNHGSVTLMLLGLRAMPKIPMDVLDDGSKRTTDPDAISDQDIKNIAHHCEHNIQKMPCVQNTLSSIHERAWYTHQIMLQTNDCCTSPVDLPT